LPKKVKKMINAIKQALANSFSYENYRKHVTELITKGLSTGHTQSEDLLKYSELNESRMNRLEKTIQVAVEVKTKLENLDKKYIWLVLSEGWCGDAAQILPVINKIAEASTKINLKVVCRDENDELMNQFLTNGSKSIPKIIIVDNNNEVINSWGPRPSIAAKMVLDYKDKNGGLDDVFKKDLQIWYNKDKGTNTQKDLVELLKAS
jgi:hypothetical protein